jgi:hypothetical protein
MKPRKPVRLSTSVIPGANPRLASRRSLILGIVSTGFTSALFRGERAVAKITGLAGRSTPGKSVNFSNGATSTAWINFEMPDYRRVILPARINGRAVKVLLDSGIGHLILDGSLAEDLGLRKLGSVNGVGVTGVAHGKVVEGVSVAFDNLSIGTSESELYDMTPFAGLFNEPIAALIGRDLFDSLIVDIDFAHTRIAFKDPGGTEAVPGAFRLPLSQDRFGLRSVPISLEGSPPIQATLDLGSDRPLSISPQYAASQNLLSNRKTSTTLSAGISGSEEGQIAVLSKLRMGPAQFSQVPFQVPRTWTFENQAIVGLPVIRRTRMVIDFPHDRISVLPDQTAMLQPFRKDRSGLGAKRLADRLQVMHVAKDSPAAAAGFHVGDAIIAINDQPLDAEYFRKHPRDGSQPAGTVLNFTLSTHERIKLTLADYY